MKQQLAWARWSSCASCADLNNVDDDWLYAMHFGMPYGMCHGFVHEHNHSLKVIAHTQNIGRNLQSSEVELPGLQPDSRAECTWFNGSWRAKVL